MIKMYYLLCNTTILPGIMIGGSRDQLVVALLFVGRHLLDVAMAEVADEGARLTVAETALLLAVRAFPGSSQSEIATILGRDKTTLSRTVTALQDAGFVDTRMDPVDGRRKTLELTERARLAVVPALEKVTTRLEDVSAGLTEGEEAACFKLIEHLMNRLLVV
jgi:DNA-binding MarR family transcriptional regulator